MATHHSHTWQDISQESDFSPNHSFNTQSEDMADDVNQYFSQSVQNEKPLQACNDQNYPSNQASQPDSSPSDQSPHKVF